MQKLVLLLLMAIVTHNALASYDIKDENTYSSTYNIIDEDNKFVELVSIDSRYTEFEIPATVAIDGEEYAVVEIAEKAFYNNTTITKVVLPSTVTIIDVNAFYGCTALKDVELSTTLTTIGAHAFFNCAFENIDLPESLTQIDTYAFNACKNLTEITIPTNVTEIQSYVFCACTNLKTVNLSAGIEVIDNYAFSSCSNITTFNVDAVTPPTIGTNSLACKPATATVNVPDEAAWNYYKSDWATYFTIGNNLSFTDGTYNYSVTSQSDKTVEVTGFTGEYIIIDNIIDEVAYDDELTFTITSVADGLFSNVVLWVPAVEDYNDVAFLFKDVKKNPDIYYEGVYYNIIKSTLKATTIQLEVASGPEAYTGDMFIPDGFYYDGDYYQVIGIAYDAFSNTSNLASVILDTTVPIENADALLQIPDGCTIVITNRDTYEELVSADPGNKNIVFKDETVDNNTQTATDTEEHEKGDTTGTDNTVNVGGGLGSTRTEFPSEKSTDADEVTTEGVLSAIANININRVEVARYTLQGAKISEPQKGINIVKYSDGSTAKVLVK